MTGLSPLVVLDELRRRADDHPSAFLAWQPLQAAFVSDHSSYKMMRAGNQWAGKTEALCAEMRWCALGTHPAYEVREPPVSIYVISPTYKLSNKLQHKLWKGLDKTTLIPGQSCDDVSGFGGRYPACRFRNGSTIHFLASERRGISLASFTCDYIFIDEPTTERLFEEASRRVAMRAGRLIMGFTPINAPEPLDWLKKKSDAGVITEYHAPLTPEQLIPLGYDRPRTLLDGTPLDETWIKRERERIDSHNACIVLDGEWETPPDGQAFPAFDPRLNGSHVVDAIPPDLELDLWLGIDHGERDHKQVAVLVGLQQGGVYPCVWVLDEYVGEGLTTPEVDAEGILAMLGRWGWSWSQLTGAAGDKPHDVRRITRSVARKSNADLHVAIARRLNLAPGRLSPPIRQAKTGRGGGRGSVDRGVRWLHTAMLRDGGFRIHVNCQRGIKSLARWAWEDDEWKDWIDALRYGTHHVAMRTARILAESPTVRVR